MNDSRSSPRSQPATSQEADHSTAPAPDREAAAPVEGADDSDESTPPKLSRSKQVCLLLVLNLAGLSLIRLFTSLRYHTYFGRLSAGDLLDAFLLGLRVDLICLATFVGPWVFLLLAPGRFAARAGYRRALLLCWWLSYLVIAGICYGGALYFEFSGRHMSSELQEVSADAWTVLETSAGTYPVEIACFFVVAIGLSALWWRVSRAPVDPTPRTLGILRWLLVAVVILLCSRGKLALSGRPFGVIDAFPGGVQATGNLALNGFFTLYRSRGIDGDRHRTMCDEEAERRVGALLQSDRARLSHPGHSVMRRYPTKRPVRRHNVVILILESWSAQYTGSFGEDWGATPHFDRLAVEGRRYQQFYASGQRSIHGLTAVIAGVSLPSGLEPLGGGLELSRVSFLGSLARSQGYHTVLAQSSKRRSLRLDAIARAAGFEEYYGAQDMPNAGQGEVGQPTWGTWDANMYEQLYRRFEATDGPFLAVGFTSSTHTPFVSPGARWETRSHNARSLNGFLNVLGYADEALGQFVDRCRATEWGKNTLFLVLADHTLKAHHLDDPGESLGPLQNFRVPLLLLGPAIEPGDDQRVSSQADILPTLVDHLGWNVEFASSGQSLLDPTARPFALLREGSMMVFATPDGFVRFGLGKRLESSIPEASLGEASANGEALAQFIASSVSRNKWAR